MSCDSDGENLPRADTASPKPLRFHLFAVLIFSSVFFLVTLLLGMLLLLFVVEMVAVVSRGLSKALDFLALFDMMITSVYVEQLGSHCYY